MSESTDEQKIREVIGTWIQATADGDLDRVLSLMAEDVVFLLPGRPPLRGRTAYEEASRGMAGRVRIEGKPEVQEIQVAGDMAYCWNHLSLTVTPTAGTPVQRAGHTLSIFRKEPDGRWLLFRDANMLVTLESGTPGA